MKKIILIAVLLTGLLFIWSCGSSSTNSNVTRDPATNNGHPADWMPLQHSIAAQSDLTPCTTCHGSDLSGGITGVSCTQCHIGSPTAVHPATFAGYTWAPAGHAAYAGSNGTTTCSNVFCHGADLSGVSQSGPSCTSCHIGGPTMVHPANYNGGAWVPLEHSIYVDNNGTSSCSNILCHAADLSGVANSGPSCTSCHLGGPTAVHPAAWASNGLLHGQYVDANGTSACRNPVCHGNDLTGVSLSGISCFTCHNFTLP